jgi:type VI secretion system lysozyme-like protein
VRAELTRLLNSRVSVPAHRLHERERTVIDYGIPDFSFLSPHSRSARDWLGREIGDAVRAFEPRLQDVQVTFEPDADISASMALRVHAKLVADGEVEPISFPIMLKAEPGQSEVHAAS